MNRPINRTNRQIWLVASAAATLLCSAGSASADSTQGYYVSGDGGVSLLPSLHLNGAAGKQHERFDAGYAYGGAVGYDTGNGMRIELDTTHQQSQLTKLSGAPDNGHLQSTSAMVNGQIDLLHNAIVTPYAGVGIGYQNISATAGGFSGSDWKPAYQAEAGLRTDLSKQVSLFGEYRFSQSEAADLSQGGLSAHQHFADHGLLAGLTYRVGQQ
jgi:opacity protein-like surface antigen